MDTLHAEVWRMFDGALQSARDELDRQIWDWFHIKSNTTNDRVKALHSSRVRAGLCRCCGQASAGTSTKRKGTPSRCRDCQDKFNERERAKRAAKKGNP